GFFLGEVILPFGAVVGLTVLWAGRRAGWGAGAIWAALAVLGQAAVLTVIQAGPRVWYQHLRLGADLFESVRPVAVAVLVLQAVVVAWAGRDVAAAAVRALLGGGRLRTLLIVATFVLTAATLSRDLVFYAGELVVAALLQALQLWTVALAAARVPATVADRWGARLDRAPPGEGWVVALSLVVVAVTAALNAFSYEATPHVPDELVYLIHARTFAAGLIDLPLPPVPAGFELDLMTVDPDRWFSPVPPGWPAVLAIGVALGAPSWVNPVLSGLAVWLTARVVRLVYPDARVAWWSAVLLALSPWFLFQGMNYMTHAVSLVAALAAAFCVGRTVRDGAAAWLLPGGLAIGMVGLIRPFEGLLVAVVLGLWTLCSGARGPVTRIVRTTVLAAGTLAMTAVQFPYNRALTGHPLRFPIMDYTDRMYGPGSNALGFGPDRGLGWVGLDPLPGHGLPDVLINANLNLFQLNIELLGWSVGSLLGLLALVGVGRWVKRDWAVFGAAAWVAGAHSFYWFAGGPDFGARYWYLMIVPLIVLTVRGVLELSTRWHPGRVGLATAILLVGTVALFTPWRAVDKYHHYREMRPDVRRLAEAAGFGEDALVLVRGQLDPDYQSAAYLNPIDLEGPGPLYAWDRSPEVRRALLDAYPDRAIWLVDGPTVTGRGFELVDGPIRDRTGLEADIAR
ncbi:MAG: hypothetical protein HKN71_01375, partial [Gemmatimonadetes bacterium]|nr:hypothetical protein [Gemmatimonadota bacterium]